MRRVVLPALLHFVLALALVQALPALAQAPLTPERVESVVEIFEELRRQDTLDSLGDVREADPADPAEGVRTWLHDMTLNGQIRSLLARHGFTPESWVDEASRVVMAYGALKLSEDPLLLAEMEETRRQVRASPDLSAQEKQDILRRMDAALKAFDSSSPTIQADKQAVLPLAPRLDALDQP